MHRPDFRETRRRVGERGAVLVVLSIFYIGNGLSWVFPTEEARRAQSAVWRDSIAPTWLWGGLWIIVGCLIMVAGLVRRLDANLGFGPAGALMLMWASLEFLGWINGAIDQGYRPSLIWTTLAVLIWFMARMRDRPARPDREC